MKNEIVLYRPNELAEHIEVLIDEDTVWLSQVQIVRLFQRDQSVISRHIRNVFKEGELHEKSNMQKMHIANSDKPVAFYNLDVIISVGYRVKSKQGTQFRIWATRLLKEYLLKGYAVNSRINRMEENIYSLTKKVDEIDFQIKTSLPPNEGIFFNGQIFDAWVFISDLVKSAEKSLILIDNYVDESVLNLFLKRKDSVAVKIYTANVTALLKTDLEKHNKQYPPIEIKVFKNAHDRFLIIDEKQVYHIGASLKDLGKKLFAFSKMEIGAEAIMGVLKTEFD
jgi:hypothetical protein